MYASASLGVLSRVHHAAGLAEGQDVYLRQLPVLRRLSPQVHALALVGAQLLGCAGCRQRHGLEETQATMGLQLQVPPCWRAETQCESDSWMLLHHGQ